METFSHPQVLQFPCGPKHAAALFAALLVLPEPRPDRFPQQEPEPLRVKEEWVEVRVGEEEREVLKLPEAGGSDQNRVHPGELLRTGE